MLGNTTLSLTIQCQIFQTRPVTPDPTAAGVIERLGAMFSPFGIPMKVCSDNGPQFSSHAFALSAEPYDFKCVTSSTMFPQSNGMAEKGVQVNESSRRPQR